MKGNVAPIINLGDRRQDFVTIWNNQISAPIFGQIVKKPSWIYDDDANSTQIVIQHFNLSTTNQNQITKCNGCPLNNRSTNTIETSTGSKRYFKCTEIYDAVYAYKIMNVRTIRNITSTSFLLPTHYSEHLALAKAHNYFITHNENINNNTPPTPTIIQKHIKNRTLQNALHENVQKVINAHNITIYIGGRYVNRHKNRKHAAFCSAYTILSDLNIIATLFAKNDTSPNIKQVITTSLFLAILSIPTNTTHTINIKTDNKKIVEQFYDITNNVSFPRKLLKLEENRTIWVAIREIISQNNYNINLSLATDERDYTHITTSGKLL